MSSGIRATVEFTTAAGCPILSISQSGETTVDSVVTNVCQSEDSGCVTEFALPSGHDPAETVPAVAFTEVFSHGRTTRYRFDHGEGLGCPCECLGQFGCPIARYVAADGTLTIVFHAGDYEELRTIVADLRDRYPGMDIKRFVRSPAGGQAGDSVLVDRSKLTDRQREVLRRAHEMGYFERPRGANATEIAAELDIDPSTFTQHLTAAQAKIFEDLL